MRRFIEERGKIEKQVREKESMVSFV